MVSGKVCLCKQVTHTKSKLTLLFDLPLYSAVKDGKWEGVLV